MKKNINKITLFAELAWLFIKVLIDVLIAIATMALAVYFAIKGNYTAGLFWLVFFYGMTITRKLDVMQPENKIIISKNIEFKTADNVEINTSKKQEE